MSNPTAAQALTEIIGRGAVTVHEVANLLEVSPREAREVLESLRRSGQISRTHVWHPRGTLAQAQADQQTRLRGLVGTWQGRAMVDRSYGRTVNASTYEKCAAELEAVLGGKE